MSIGCIIQLNAQSGCGGVGGFSAAGISKENRTNTASPIGKPAGRKHPGCLAILIRCFS
ncbi:hypothetical protein [Nafulsella turpanensis]|uniref:hypothetical protein n=1 Tax=Nafulsella turpanensis TaxID=1265690 RepID=UPI00135F1225|nr:hypothetical protein [Nafulsella turpanensis]